MTNIVVFLKAGVKDNVTTLLLSLSVSDITFLMLITPQVCSIIIAFFAPNWPWPFHIGFLNEMLYWPAYTFYEFSSYISVWLGVTRCACVAMPLKFKSVFTKTRTVKAVIIIFIVSVSLRVPVMSMFRTAWKRDPKTNVSSVYFVKQNSELITHFNDALNRGSLPMINFIIMITCVCVIKTKLYQASLVRNSQIATSAADSKQEMEGQDNQGRSSKDLRVIQSVVLICCIFIVSQLPFLAYSLGRLIEPEFDITGSLRFLFHAFSAVSRLCSYLNASVNIFVYYNYNSKYISTLLLMLRGMNVTKIA
ncbi:chemosensory receptor c [Plakobranchus ocellatus]|uniref:Chemosensory receptor c n=1 Tax=Plakobranchus ocellatus TaxID=259542 RepID=A0AAV3ZGA2_9GAST|nr:chemosensory receptor c [Plakobranchus ocellatus]